MESTSFLILCFCAVLIISLKSIISDGHHLSNDPFACIAFGFFILDAIALVLWHIWKLLDDPLLGEVSFDMNGATFYTKLHTYSYSYAECLDIGFISAPGGQFVYLSRAHINGEQKAHLFHRITWRRGKRNMPLYRSEYVLFQFEADIFAEFITYVPEPFHTKLIDDLGWDYE